MIKFRCHSCNQKMGVPDEYATKTVRCTKCGTPAKVPEQANQLQSEPVIAATESVGSSGAGKFNDDGLNFNSGPDPFSDFNSSRLEDQLDFQTSRDLASSEPVTEAEDDIPPYLGKVERTKQAVGRSELVTGVAKIPLSLGVCFAAMAAVIVAWVVIGKITGFEFGFIVLAVPAAGAWGLTKFTEHRGVMLGLLCVLLGFVGMISGRMAVAKWVIMPMIQESEEYQNAIGDFSKGFSEHSQETVDKMTSDEMNKVIVDDNEMIFVAAISLANEGGLDRETVKQMILLEFQDKSETQKQDESVDSQPQQDKAQLEQAYSLAIEQLVKWDDNARIQAVKKYYAELNSLKGEVVFNKINEKVDVVSTVTFIMAFVASFGLFDLFWIPMGVYGAYKIGAGVDS